MAAHESPRITKLYDRTGDEITLEEVERICEVRKDIEWARSRLSMPLCSTAHKES